MDLPATFNAARLVELGSEPFWVRGYTMDDYATIVGWLDDVLPGKQERAMPPALSSPEAQEAMDSLEGWMVLVWAALRHSGVTYQHCKSLAVAATDLERSRFMSVVFSRRKTFQPKPGGKDIGEGWWGPLVESFSKHRNMAPEQVGMLTPDQLDALTDEGLPREEPGRLTVEDMQRIWEEDQAKLVAGAN